MMKKMKKAFELLKHTLFQFIYFLNIFPFLLNFAQQLLGQNG